MISLTIPAFILIAIVTFVLGLSLAISLVFLGIAPFK